MGLADTTQHKVFCIITLIAADTVAKQNDK